MQSGSCRQIRQIHRARVHAGFFVSAPTDAACLAG